MKVVGVLTTVVLGALAAAASIEALRMLPDVKRYLRIRSM